MNNGIDQYPVRTSHTQSTAVAQSPALRGLSTLATTGCENAD